MIRFEWAVDAWNGPWQIAWSDRVSPKYCSFARSGNSPYIGWGQERGWPGNTPYSFCNETGKDMWLNMPIGANDGYIAELARLVKEQYTVPGGKVYWEYSNEATWDGEERGKLFRRIYNRKGWPKRKSAGLSGYDGQREDLNVLAARYYAKRAEEMSVIWAECVGRRRYDDQDPAHRDVGNSRTIANSSGAWDSSIIGSTMGTESMSPTPHTP